MADNYLEKRMDDYRSGRLATRRQSSSVAVSAKKMAAARRLRYGSALVVVGDKQLRDAIAAALVAAGVRTAFCHTDATAGRLEAQRMATLFVPVSLMSDSEIARAADLVATRWRGLHAIVTDMEAIASATALPTIVVTPDEDLTAEDIAQAAVEPFYSSSAKVALRNVK